MKNIDSRARRRYFVIGVAIVVLFILLQFLRSKPFIGHHAQFQIFYQNNQEFGSGFFPAFNFQMTRPPSDVYVPAGPLVTWLVYSTVYVFGDKPVVYECVFISISAVFFFLLFVLVARRWGAKIAVWTIFFAALSKFALRFGNVQTFEIASAISIFATVFLYFEWIEKRRSRYFVLSVVVYFLGLLCHYLTMFVLIPILAHWLLLNRSRNRNDTFKIALFPVLSVIYLCTMLVILRLSSQSFELVLARALSRATASTWIDFLVSLATYPLFLIGPSVVVAAIVIVSMAQAMSGRGNNKIMASKDLAILHCLWISGLIPWVIFKNWFVIHPYGLYFLLPFFSVACAMAAVRLLESKMLHWKRYVVVALIVVPFVLLSFQGATIEYGNKILTRDNHRLVIRSRGRGVEERIDHLSRLVKPSLTSGDSLLVLDEYGSRDYARICAFYVLRIPTERATTPAEWRTALMGETDSLVLSMSEEASQMVENLENAQLIGMDKEIKYYRVGY